MEVASGNAGSTKVVLKHGCGASAEVGCAAGSGGWTGKWVRESVLLASALEGGVRMQACVCAAWRRQREVGTILGNTSVRLALSARSLRATAPRSDAVLRTRGAAPSAQCSFFQVCCQALRTRPCSSGARQCSPITQPASNRRRGVAGQLKRAHQGSNLICVCFLPPQVYLFGACVTSWKQVQSWVRVGFEYTP